MNSKILVATHKAYTFPSLPLYAPIQVGKKLSPHDFGYIGDDSGTNISSKNRNFCELTALYWAWKNHYFKDVAYCGLVHYRRYFKGEVSFNGASILSSQAVEDIMKGHDIILPKKRNYYIESISSHYAHAHFAKDFQATREVIQEKYPEYLETYDTFSSQKTLHLYNMFIMKTENFTAYVQWLFDILMTLEQHTDLKDYDLYQQRVFGFLSERLLNVWVLHHHYRVKELPVVQLEGENLLLKAYNLLKRKFISTT